MKLILFVTEKGGSGKTTLARNLAVTAAQDGHRVLLLDYDPQQSLRRWWESREAENPEMLVEEPAPTQLARKRDALGAFDYVIVDTPPIRSDAAGMGHLLSMADLALVPVTPSPDDLRAVGGTLEALTKRKVSFAFVLNRAPRGRLTEEARAILAGHGRVAPTPVQMRVAFLDAATSGQGVTEGPDRKAADEINALWTYTQGILK